MNIPSIGNSSSQDVRKWLSHIAEGGNTKIHAVNLYIGSYFLERHSGTDGCETE